MSTAPESRGERGGPKDHTAGRPGSPVEFASSSPAVDRRASRPLRTRALYLCYFGLREPLVQTQVLPYLRRLAAAGAEVSLLTFEPRMREEWGPRKLDEERAALAGEGIRWYSLPYHKRPTLPATLYDIVQGARFAAGQVRNGGVEVMHARSHVPAAMGALAKWASGGRLVFDVRNFLPEEYVDAGIWPAGGYLYRLTKAAERRLFAAADAFVVLTEQARRILFGADGLLAATRPMEVIPCCVDLERFRAVDHLSRDEIRRELGLEGRRVLVYVGALGGWYLTGEMAEFLATAHRRDHRTFSMVLTQSDPEMISAPLRELGVREEDFLIRRVAPGEIPRYLKAADVALSFIKQSYSKLASSPTKLAEYLAAGLPVICNAGVGDVDQVIEEDGVGVIVRELGVEAYRRALEQAEELMRDEGLAERCRASARKRFDLEEVGGFKYIRLYRRLLDGEKATGV